MMIVWYLWHNSNHRHNVGLVQGCKAVICMPVTTPEIKIEAVRRLGGQVKLVGETYSETQTYAQVHPSHLCTFNVVLSHASGAVWNLKDACTHCYPDSVHVRCMQDGVSSAVCS